jgi:hypothetical protein
MPITTTDTLAASLTDVTNFGRPGKTLFHPAIIPTFPWKEKDTVPPSLCPNVGREEREKELVNEEQSDEEEKN